MKRTIAVPASDQASQKAVAKAGLLPLPVEEGAGFPGAALAALAGGKHAAEGLRLANGAAESHERLLLLLAEAVDCREGIPAGSAMRLAEHASRFAEALGLSDEESSQLERAAILRAVGKIRLSNEILLKKSVLDYDEWLLLKKYPVHGAELLEEWGLHADVAPIVRAHQEAYDGTGYPDGLEGEAIPPLARVLRILVVFCAMTSSRHYRTTVTSTDDAVEHFKRERGKHFDPDYVDVFIAHQVGQPAE